LLREHDPADSRRVARTDDETRLPSWFLTGSASLVNAMDAERMGVGLETCGEFASLYRRVPNITEQSSWAQGYMSGMNMASLAHGDISKNMGAMAIDEQERTLRKYCNDHPLTTKR